MKKRLKWAGVVLLSPVLLFLLLAALLYVPAIQNWVAQRVVSYVSEQTGMEISVEHVDLDFPLDLGLDGLRIVKPDASGRRDTIADIQRAVADVKLWPLLRQGRVVLDALQLRQARLNTLDFIGDLRLQGTIGCLTFTSPGIDLEQMEVELRGPRLSDTDLTVYMSDTAAVDTSTVGWRIRFDRFDLERTRIAVLMDSAARFADATTRINAYMGEGRIDQADLDLGLARFAFGRIDWTDGALSYNDLFALSNVRLGLDSLYSFGPDLRVGIREATLREDSTGIDVGELHGAISMSGDQLRLQQLKAVASAEWEGRPVVLHAQVDGDTDHLDVEQLSVTMPTALHFEASGQLADVLDLERMQAKLSVKADAYDLGFLPLGPSLRIPRGLTVQGDIEADTKQVTADVTMRDGSGSASLKGKLLAPLSALLNDDDGLSTLKYDATLKASRLNLRHFMPRDSLGLLTAELKLKGSAPSNLTQLGAATGKASPWGRLEGTADLQLHSLQYGQWLLDSIQATASLTDGRALIAADVSNRLLRGTLDIDADLATLSHRNTDVKATVEADLQHVDLHALGITDAPTVVAMSGSFELNSDLQRRHQLSALVSNISLRDTVKTHHPENFGLLVKTSADTTKVRVQSGDLIVKLDAQEDYEHLFAKLGALADTIGMQLRERTIDQPQLKRLLPEGKLYITSQRNNPVADILRAATGIDFLDMQTDLTLSPLTGVNGTARLLQLSTGDMQIDTMRISLVEKTQGLTFNGQVTNGKKNKMGAFNVLFDGRLQEHGASFGVRYFDDQGRRNIRIGAQAEMVADGLHFKLIPTRPTLGYKEFTLNADNFLLLHDDLRLEANVDLLADDGTHILVYSENQDSTLLQDLTISVHQLDLGELTGNIALLPNISGKLEGDYHLMMGADRNISVASDMQVAQMAYEGSPIGNLGSEFVYLLREDGTHVVDASLLLDDEAVGTLQGSYLSDKRLDATLHLTGMPLAIVNGFIPDQLLGFEGTANGELSVKGELSNLQSNGKVSFDGGYLVSNPYGMRMRFGDKPLEVKDSKLLFTDFALYAYNNNPLNISGSVDLNSSGTDAVNLRLRSQNFQLINAKQKKESVAYGKMFVNFFARLTGNLDQLNMRGRLDVLGTTDLNYILLDSPLSTDNQMDELVRFTDFSDTTLVVVQRPESDALSLDMQLSIDQGAHVRCALNAEQTNYVDLLGGGDLRMRMLSDGLSLNGRYTVQSGTMKYSLPVIPLKTFNIKEGSYVEFTGDPANPTLNLTATERTRSAVASADGQNRTVSFDCGVVITQTLENMGLQFTIDAPEDMQVHSELASMSLEERGKLAVTMLTTGMYLADGNTAGFTMNSALNSFLQSEINNITAGALKTVDLQVGLDNATDATGQTRTDYSFSFAKRFWNNRLSVQIGGKVSTGAEVQGQQQSFFDNVTMEYRLSPTSNKYVKLFYNQNVYDWLDGYTGEYGGGFVWKRKLDRLIEIIKPQQTTPSPIPRERSMDRPAMTVTPQTTQTPQDTIQ